MNSKQKVGVIGAGMIGDDHIRCLRNDGRAEVTWIATRTETTLQEKLKKHGVSNGALDYRDILNASDVDAVIIASPPYTHLDITLAALQTGKHILLEKPMTANRHDLNRLVSAVEKFPDLIVLECSCRHARLQPKFQFIKNIIESGEIGEVYHIHHNHLMRRTFIEYNPHGTWALEKAKAGGGPLVDWGVYDLSFHLGLMDDQPKLVNVQSFTKNGLKVFQNPDLHQDIEEHGAAFMKFDTGLTYYYERGAGVQSEIANETRLFGTCGSMRFGFCSWDSPDVEVFLTDKVGNETREMRKVPNTEGSDDNQALIRHFMDCLIQDDKPMMPVSLAAKHLDIIFKILACES